MVFITKSSSISAWLWLGLALSFLMVQQKRSGIKGIKSLKKSPQGNDLDPKKQI